MNSLRVLSLRLARQASINADLLGLWVLLVAIQPAIPIDHFLARESLAPWLMLTLSAVAFLRTRSIGPGPHPMLTLRLAIFVALMRRASIVAIPWALLFWYDGVSQLSPAMAGAAIGIIIVIIVLLAIGNRSGQTAWAPPGIASWKVWVGGGASITIILSIAAFVSSPTGPLAEQGLNLPQGVGVSALLGCGFLAAGLIPGRTQHLRQRRAAGRRDGKPYRIDWFPMALAISGPGIGLLVLFLVLGDDLNYTLAAAGALHVVVWGAVIWPKREPIARACILHEVVPAGGEDKEASTSALSFEKPPEGALRLNPLRCRRIRVIHPWLVPVRGSRIEGLDDPVQPLWAERIPFLRPHILGDAAFEPDPITKKTQWDVLTIKMSGQEDVAKVQSGDAQTRRIVVLRPFPPPGRNRRKGIATYRWESGVPQESLQILDPTVEAATLYEGDILVLSSEGVARAFEVEMGAPLYDPFLAEAFRPPQLEDYVKV